MEGALSKARRIWDLLQAGKKPKEIAAIVDCDPAYVRVVRQRGLNPERMRVLDGPTNNDATTPMPNIVSGSRRATARAKERREQWPHHDHRSPRVRLKLDAGMKIVARRDRRARHETSSRTDVRPAAGPLRAEPELRTGDSAESGKPIMLTA
jgi:hypothetical protein